MSQNDDNFCEILNPIKIKSHNASINIDAILKKTLGVAFIRQLANLKIKKAAFEAIHNFDYELVQDYIELTGTSWTSYYGKKTQKVPDTQEIQHFLIHHINNIIQTRKTVELHAKNNFVFLFNGDHITIMYCVAKIVCGSKIKEQ